MINEIFRIQIKKKSFESFEKCKYLQMIHFMNVYEFVAAILFFRDNIDVEILQYILFDLNAFISLLFWMKILVVFLSWARNMLINIEMAAILNLPL